jgi:tetratricopeptide (TPR) repeat protein
MKRLLPFSVAAALLACGGSTSETLAPVVVAVGDAGPPPPVAIARHTPPSEPPPAPAPSEPVDPARDPRRAVATPRRAALLEAETSALDQLLAATSPSAPDRPTLLRRIAESEVELTRARERERTGEPEGARRRAIDAYETLLRDYPSYAASDEARYFLALEHERSGDLSKARRAYYELIQRSPQSRYVPYAYFAFGEMFRREAEGDPSRVDLARQAYREAAKYPAPANALHDLALERMAEMDRRTPP